MTRSLLAKVVEGHDLSRTEARTAMEAMLDGTMTPVQIAAFLTSLRIKGETVDELVGLAEGLRARAIPVHAVPGAVDTCGTGGDGGRTFNVSTAAAIVVAAAGIPVAKHGNRAVSGTSGSVDVLEALGIEAESGPEQAERMLKHVGLCFLFAPLFHPALKRVMPVRRELGFRTCFHLLGPLASPAGVRRQVLGVYHPALTENVARVLCELGAERALVVAGLDGLDEISVSGVTRVSEVTDGRVRTYDVMPEDLGLSRAPLTAVRGGTPNENASLIRRIFAGERGAPRNMVVANAGAAIYVGGGADSLAEGVRLAAEAIDSGRAASKLEEVIAFSQEVRHVS
jgi:anthranilate phosphoribosyltransferase